MRESESVTKYKILNRKYKLIIIILKIILISKFNILLVYKFNIK